MSVTGTKRARSNFVVSWRASQRAIGDWRGHRMPEPQHRTPSCAETHFVWSAALGEALPLLSGSRARCRSLLGESPVGVRKGHQRGFQPGCAWSGPMFGWLPSTTPAAGRPHRNCCSTSGPRCGRPWRAANRRRSCSPPLPPTIGRRRGLPIQRRVIHQLLAAALPIGRPAGIGVGCQQRRQGWPGPFAERDTGVGQPGQQLACARLAHRSAAIKCGRARPRD